MAEFFSKDVVVKEHQIRVQIWDTAGQELFKSISDTLYKNKDGFFIVFDITNRKSFEGLGYWIDQINNNSVKDVPIVLIGNKIDLSEKRVVSFEEASAFAKKHCFKYIETSALTNENDCIDNAFRILLESFLKRNSDPNDRRIEN